MPSRATEHQVDLSKIIDQQCSSFMLISLEEPDSRRACVEVLSAKSFRSQLGFNLFIDVVEHIARFIFP